MTSDVLIQTSIFLFVSENTVLKSDHSLVAYVRHITILEQRRYADFLSMMCFPQNSVKLHIQIHLQQCKQRIALAHTCTDTAG